MSTPQIPRLPQGLHQERKRRFENQMWEVTAPFYVPCPECGETPAGLDGGFCGHCFSTSKVSRATARLMQEENI